MREAAMSSFLSSLSRRVFVPVVTVFLGGVLGCSRSPVLTVRNDSGLTLSNLVVSGTGFSERLADVPPGGEVHRRVRPRGESGVRLTFEAGTNRVDSGAQGYFEGGGGARIQVRVGTNLSVSIAQ